MAKACNWEITSTMPEAKTKIDASIEYALSFPAIAKSAENISNFAAAYKEISCEEPITGHKRPQKLATRELKRKRI